MQTASNQPAKCSVCGDDLTVGGPHSLGRPCPNATPPVDQGEKVAALLAVLRQIALPKPLTYPQERLDAVRKMAREAVAKHG